LVLPVPHTPEDVPIVPPNIDSPPKPPVEEPPSKDPDEDKPVEEPEHSPPEVPPHDAPQPDPVDDPTPNEPPLDDPGRTPPVQEPPRDFGVADGIRTHNNRNHNSRYRSRIGAAFQALQGTIRRIQRQVSSGSRGHRTKPSTKQNDPFQRCMSPCQTSARRRGLASSLRPFPSAAGSSRLHTRQRLKQLRCKAMGTWRL
jgi:outer membrane biosynthesis protein TonB